ncbi:MAG: ATP-binding protein [Planctomycetes bacterium]|nr:ATP-binding protein [Planctomycetota bacterium]
MSTTFARRMFLIDGISRFEEARDFVREALQGSPFADRDRRMISLAIDEAMATFVEYARSTGRPSGKVELSVDLNDTRLRVELSDSQNDFYLGEMTPDEMLDVQAAHASHRLGLWLILHLMDEVTYVYRRGLQNALVLTRFTP